MEIARTDTSTLATEALVVLVARIEARKAIFFGAFGAVGWNGAYASVVGYLPAVVGKDRLGRVNKVRGSGSGLAS